MDRKEELLNEVVNRLAAAKKTGKTTRLSPPAALALGVLLGAAVTAASAAVVVGNIKAGDNQLSAGVASPKQTAGFELYQPVSDLCAPQQDLLDPPPIYRDYSGI